MEKSKKIQYLRLIDLGYDVTLLRNLRCGDTFQLREDGTCYVFSHYVASSKKFCYHRISDINRYYYDDGDTLVINRNCC